MTNWDVSIQEHNADKAGLHYDFRLSDGEKAYSWALRKGVPEPGEKHLAVKQPDHAPEYMDYEGEITEGYGKGQVKLVHNGKAKIIETSPDKIKFALISKRIPDELVLLKTQKDWLMLNTSPLTKNYPTTKEHYKEAKNVQGLIDNPNMIFEPKIDGAHVLWDLNGSFPKVYSYRPSVYSEKMINHTYRIPGIENISIPEDIKKMLPESKILRGELFATKNGVAVPPNELNKYLNSNTDNALQQEKQDGVQMSTVIFDIQDSKDTYSDKIKILKKISEKIPFLKMPKIAIGGNQKQIMLGQIKNGQEPLTREGIVAWPLNGGKPIKFKFKQDFDVFVREVLPNSFSYSLTPNGEVVGKCAYYTGDATPGKIAVIESQEQFPSGALRAPVFKNWNLERNI